MDSFLSRIGRVAAGFSFALFAAFFALVPARAVASTNASYDAAMTSCLNYADTSKPSHFSPDPEEFDHCGLKSGVAHAIYFWIRCQPAHPGCLPYEPYPYTYWSFTGDPPPSNPCTSLAPANIYMDGKVANGYSFTENATDPNTGATVQCAMSAAVQGAPVWNPWSQKWQTYVTVSPTGDPASGTGVTDGNGNPVPDVSNPPSFDNQATTPSVCADGSCYNSGTDQYCATSGGAQFCVSGSTARNSPGGCGGSSSVLCGGSPSAPLPPSSQIPDPATQAVSSDRFTQADPQTGVGVPVVVNVYKGSSDTGTPSSGQQGGDSGPASSSSSGTGSSYSGGGDCNTPPVCTGDAATCGAARTQWATTCQVHKDLTGSGPPSDFDSLKTKYGQGDVWSDPDTSQDTTVGGQANKGVYDQSGLGWSRSCPLTDWHVDVGSFGSFVVPLADKCYVGDWIRYLVIGMGLFLAAIITAGGRG